MLKREKGFHAVLTIDPLNAVSTTIAFRGSDGMYAPADWIECDQGTGDHAADQRRP